MINGFSQHALDRFIERSGVRFPDVGAACERLWSIARKAKRIEERPDGVVYACKGWRMIVTHKTIRTMYLDNAVKAKRLVFERVDGDAEGVSELSRGNQESVSSLKK